MNDTPEEPVAIDASEDNGVVRAAAVLAAGNVASRILGLARETVKTTLFGVSGLVDVYEIAAYIPTSLFDLIIGGMVNSSLVPVFSDYAQKKDKSELWQLLSICLSITVIVLLVVIGLVELFAPQVVLLLGAGNLSGEGLVEASIELTRLATPAVLFLSLASILTGVLYALKRFTLPAFTVAVYNLAIVVVALLRPGSIDSLVWGLLLGSILQTLLQLPALRDARIRWNLNWRHPAVPRILKLYAPIVAGLIITQIMVGISYNLATRTGDGSLTYMRRAITLIQFPLGLVVTALSVATLPTLSQQAHGQLEAFKRTLAEGVRLVITLILPATAGLFALAVPLVALLFEYGAFTPEDTAVTANVLRVYLIGLPFAAVDQMLVFASYARKDTWRPALVGVISVVLDLAIAIALLEPLGLFSLMIADDAKHIIHLALMLLILYRQTGGLAGHRIIITTLKSLLAATLTGLTSLGLVELLLPILPLTSLVNKLVVVGVTGAAGLVVFVLIAYAINLEETKNLLKHLQRKTH